MPEDTGRNDDAVMEMSAENVKLTVTSQPGSSKRRNLKMGAKRHPPPALPARILEEIEFVNDPSVQEAFSLMREGEDLVMVGHCCLSTSSANAFIRLDDDFIRVSYIRNRFCLPEICCFKAKRSFDIRDVLMTRLGHDGLFRVVEEDFPAKRCFSIVFEGRRKTIYFLAPTSDSAKHWVQGLSHLRKTLEDLPPRQHQILFLWEVFRKADRDNDGHLTFTEVQKLFRGKGGLVTRKDRRKILGNFLKKTTKETRHVDFSRFIEFYQTATLLPEFESIFKNYSSDNFVLTSEEILRFLQESQGECDVTEDDCLKIIEDYEINDEIRGKKQMSVHGFVTFMLSPNCDVFNRKHDEVYQDMTQPLSHYFIASSHNTYLLKDQLRGPSSTDAYMKALLQGCRCVELDCWDGDDGEPEIFHGYTLTSKIKFRDAIEVIYKYAFETSKFPVILSLENHCSVEQQEKMAEYMQQIIGEKLIRKGTFNESDEERLPSPESLQGRVLVKGKKLPDVTSENEESIDDDDVSDEDEAAEMGIVVTAERRGKLKKILHKHNRHDVISTDKEPQNVDEAEASENTKATDTTPKSQERHGKKLKLSKNLSDQVVYCKSSKFKGIDEALQTTSYKEISSFSENKAYRLASQDREKAVQFHVDHLNRTYPGGTRTDSSNYNPQPLWNAGFQVVALNYQTKCDEMTLYHAKFRQNGRCGYVLKPEFMTSSTGMVAQEHAKDVVVKVICGSSIAVDAKGDSSLSVEIEVQGDPDDEQKLRTEKVKGSGYNPVWDQDLAFKISVPSLAMVWFRAYDEDSENVGEFVLPFCSVSKGQKQCCTLDGDYGVIAMNNRGCYGKCPYSYRTVHLLDRDGISMKDSHLLIHVTMT